MVEESNNPAAMGEYASSTPHKEEVSAGTAAAVTSTMAIIAIKAESWRLCPPGLPHLISVHLESRSRAAV